MLGFFNPFNDPFYNPPSRFSSRPFFDPLFDNSIDSFIKDCERYAKRIENENNRLINSYVPSDSLTLFNQNNSVSFLAEWKDDEENHCKKLILSNLPTGDGTKVDVLINANNVSVVCEESIKKESNGFKSYSTSRVERSFPIPKGVDLSKVSNSTPKENMIEIIFPVLEEFRKPNFTLTINPSETESKEESKIESNEEFKEELKEDPKVEINLESKEPQMT